jgi:hypothetical protein
MPVKNEEKKVETPETVDLSTIEGFHVIRSDDQHLGTYPTREDAEHFINQQVEPNGAEATIVEGTAA